MTAPTLDFIILSAALSLLVGGAFVYVRMSVFRDTPICRILFALRLLAVMAAMLIVYTHHATAGAALAAIYAFCSIWSWRRQIVEALRAGVKPKGVARLFETKRQA